MIDPLWFVESVLTSGLDSVGSHMSAVTDAFRRGSDLRLLKPLLASDDPDLVSVAAYMAAEVVDESRGREIFDELRPLLNHATPTVRLEAMAAVSQLVLSTEPDVVMELIGLLTDENKGVRQRALLVIGAMPDRAFADLLLGEFATWSRWLTEGISRAEALNAVASGERLSERIAVVAAARHHQHELLRELLQRTDPEVQEMIAFVAERA